MKNPLAGRGKIRCVIHTLSLFLFLAVVQKPILASQASDPLSIKVSVRLIGIPLANVVKELSKEGFNLSVNSELEPVKATILVRERPIQEVMDQLAQVFGGKWEKRETEGVPSYHLRRTTAVTRWIAAWKAAKGRAAAQAREMRARRTRAYMNDLIEKARTTKTRTEDPGGSTPGGISSVHLTRFAGLFPSQDLDTLAQWVGESTELHAGAADRQLPCPISYRFADLPPRQQEPIRAYVAEENLVGIGPKLKDATVTFRVERYIYIDFHLPSGVRFGDTVFAFGVLPEAVEQFGHDAQMELLSRQKTPPDALLGAAITSETIEDPYTQEKRKVGKAQPAVQLQDDLEVTLPRVGSLGPLLRDFLPQLADANGLNLVADYHTLSRRVAPGKGISPEPKQSLKSLLEGIAEPLQAVFRYQDGFLLARNTYWPDRDVEEVPYPLVETWLDWKRREGSLPFPEILQIAKLPVAQQNSVGAYNDRVLSLRKEVEYLRKQPQLMAILNTFTEEQWQAMAKEDGLKISTLPLLVQAALGEQFMADSSGLPIAPEWRQRAVLRSMQFTRESSSVQRDIYALIPMHQPFWQTIAPRDFVPRRVPSR